jgi:hypothetical protein
VRVPFPGVRSPPRRVVRLVVPLVALVLVVGSVAASAGPAGARDRSRTSLLFSLSGADATMTPVVGSPGRYDLALVGADPWVVWFADRPVRRSGVVGLSRLAAQWDAGAPFAVDPPNAAVVLHAPTGGTDTVVVTIRSLRADPGTRSVTARVRVLGAAQADALTGPLAFHGGRHDPLGIPSALGAVSVFIDPELSGDRVSGGPGGVLGDSWGTGRNGGAGGVGY